MRGLVRTPAVRVAGVAALAVLVVLSLAGPAGAHATLESTTPADGADLDEAPTRVELAFDEPVEVAADALRVFDADAQRVDTGMTDTGDPATVAVGLPEDLPDGGYVVTYRIVSADSHPLGGVVTFTVGGAAAVGDTVVAELFGGAGRSFAGVAGPVLRGLGYLATLLAAGAVAIAGLVARTDHHRRLARQLGRRAALAGVVVAVLALPVQGAAVAGESVWGALTSGRILGEVLASSFGLGTLVRVAGLLGVALVWRATRWRPAAAVAAVVALGSYLLDGHQRTVDPPWVLIPGDAIHLTVGAVWLAGLVVLVSVFRTSDRTTDPAAAAGFVARFSTVALVCVGVLAASGVAMALPLVGGFGALTTTSYGLTLLGKISAVAAVVVIAFYNRQRLVPLVVAGSTPRGGSSDASSTATDGSVPGHQGPERFAAAWRALHAAVRVEAVVLVAVLGITGFLVSLQPAAEQAGLRGLYETTASLGDDLEVDLVVDPNRVGSNTVHLYVLDGTGRPVQDIEEVELQLTYLDEGIGPIVLDPYFAGPGHWIANTDDLRFAGDWEVRVVVAVDRFTELTAELTVPVAP